jgi:alpha-L-fucosidase
MYQTGAVHDFHVKNFGPVDKFGYKDFIPRFTGEKFNADEWAELYRQAGAQFAGPVAEHADGFAMWDSALTQWNAKQMGPKRDIVGEMEKAVRKRGMKFVTTLHHCWLWGWYATPLQEADVLDPQYEDFYGPVLPLSGFDLYPNPAPNEPFCERWLGKTKEVISKYHPDLLWFDSKLYIIPESYRREMVSYYFNMAAQRAQRVVLTYKQDDLKGAGLLDLERSRMAAIHPTPWLTDTSIASDSWSYTTNLHYYSAERLVHDLVDIVSKNGCLLLNVAPRPDGTIPQEQRERLLAIGHWLKINGEAIYGSRPWRVFGEGPTKAAQGEFSDLKLKGFTTEDIRFTAGIGRFHKGRVYAIVLGLPRSAVRIHSLAGEPVAEVRLLGSTQKIQWKQEADALTITPPATLPCEHAITFCIQMRTPSEP